MLSNKLQAFVLLSLSLVGIGGCANGTIASSSQPPVVAKPQVTQVIGQGTNTDLAAAITNAGSNGAVEVPQGYTETINTAIHIPSAAGNLTITCDPDTALTLGASIGAPNLPGSAVGMITVDSGAGLTMSGCNLVSTNNSNSSGIVGSLLVADSGATNLTLINNTFTKCYYYCIFAIDVPTGYIHGNTFTGIRSDAMDLTGSTSNFIVDNNHCDATGITASPGHKCVDAHSAFGVITGNTSTSSTTITSVTNSVDLTVGAVLNSPGLASGTTVSTISGTTITVSAAPLVTQSGLIMTLNNIRQLSNLTIENNQMVTGTGFCVEVGDFGGAAPVNIVVTGNSCVAANLAVALPPNATFSATTTAASTTMTVTGVTGTISQSQHITGYGLSPGTTVAGVSGTTITLSLPALVTQSSVSMFTSNQSGGYSFQNVQNLSMTNNSYENTTGFSGSPGAIEIVGDTSAAPLFVGQGPTSIVGGTLVGGGISINTVANVDITGVYLQQLDPVPYGYNGAIAVGNSNNISISATTIDTRGVGPNKHDAIYDSCGKAQFGCSNLTVHGVTALDDGQSLDAAYHISFANGSDMSNLFITDGEIKGYTSSTASAYWISPNAKVTNVRIEGMDDIGNTINFSTASGGQTPGAAVYYAP